MIAYHEVRPSSAEDILHDGLRRMSRGEKGDDKLIERTDNLLDERRPKEHRNKGISRDNNIYAYLGSTGHIIDITDGASVPVSEFIARSEEVVLQIEVDPKRCYVSDLDQYDKLKSAIDEQDEVARIERLADEYWSNIVPLSEFRVGSIRRPEIMITYDVAASDIRRVS